MIRILIMDDQPDKTALIRSVLLSKCMVDENNIEVATSLNEGRRLLHATQYDLLLLDLLMPNNPGEDIRKEESAKFVEELSRFSRYKKPLQIIGLSEYEEEVEEHLDDYKTRLWKLIHFKRSSIDWEQLLQNAVQAIDDMKRSVSDTMERERNYDVGIICALPAEFDQMKTAFALDWEKFSLNDFPYDFFRAELRTENGRTLRLVSCCCNMPGMQSAAVTASLVISLFNVGALFITGFCAGFNDDDVHFGDIFVAQSEVDYGSSKVIGVNGNSEERPLPRPLECNYELLSKFNTFLTEALPQVAVLNKLRTLSFDVAAEPNIIVAPGTCGSHVVADARYMNSLKTANHKLKGLEMEGYGVYMASHILNRPCLLLKGIADMGNEHKDDRFQEQCSFASAYLLAEFLKYTY